ncbi:transcription factor MYB114-like [Punica granatum]|uniref:Uncharacterized protein n=2 Tax=Punica granatum TaxID=22663 RepID=A0A218X4Q4_PUNGR|nr:transcription factor MYB114-like [Punica granatum]OWM79904.1 hypothetical protein CDL15_Pgr001547 [Punica granatum]PKI41588.1 hypothetical protein CRG98_038027 [Punica granatum]
MDSSVTDLQRKKRINKGAWTVEEDQKLAEAIAVNGARRWKKIAAIAGLNRCGKSCRLRWMNYLRPNIKRGNISDQEEDLILRLHKLLGNRWSLIAGRLPGRTDNEIKNYWNSHLRKKINHQKKESRVPGVRNAMAIVPDKKAYAEAVATEKTSGGGEDPGTGFDVDEFFNFSMENCSDLDWIGSVLSDDRGALLQDEFNGYLDKINFSEYRY